MTYDVQIDEIGLNSKTLFCLCVLLSILDININLDHGALPSAGTKIKEDLKLPNATFGTLGSMVFLGLVGGSMVASFIFGKVSYKLILILSFLFNGVGIFGFVMVENFYVICCCRLLSGLA